jgi:hypothetical protein
MEDGGIRFVGGSIGCHIVDVTWDRKVGAMHVSWLTDRSREGVTPMLFGSSKFDC